MQEVLQALNKKKAFIWEGVKHIHLQSEEKLCFEIYASSRDAFIALVRWPRMGFISFICIPSYYMDR